jgi:hypothetical protein
MRKWRLRASEFEKKEEMDQVQGIAPKPQIQSNYIQLKHKQSQTINNYQQQPPTT